MPSFALTGGTASGKTTAAKEFEAHGAKIIDADVLGHQVILPGGPAYDAVVSAFGTSILDSDGKIDRKRLGAIVFADAQARARLNAIVHPAIMARRSELVAAYEADDPHAVVISDAALIYEAHLEPYFLKIIVAWCRPEQQLERLIAKGLSPGEAGRRIRSQMPADEKRARADYTIDCSGSIEDSKRQVIEIYAELKRLSNRVIG